jgi:predicted transcriptional regulator
MVTTMSEPNEKTLIAQISSSYLSNNTVAPVDLPSVIETVKKAFGGSVEAVPTTPSDSVTKSWQPAVPVKKIGHTRRGYMPMLRPEVQISEAALANDPSTESS